MSLINGKPVLIEDLTEIFLTESSKTESPEESRQRIAEKLAAAIDKFIRTGLVVTAGTAAAQTGNII